ncbi:MAG: hypothetical protein PWP74_850 [Shewanella sp.]|nr:hypothetical protein [Shewanella sp.]
MTVMPRTVKNARINDLKQMILPEMVPDQLKMLGVTLADFYDDNLADVQASNAGGIELIKLLERRAKQLINSGEGLYTNRKRTSPTQIEWVIKNIHLLQSIPLSQVAPTAQPERQHFHNVINQLIETAVYIGYYAGSNDTLALTDRFTDSGYRATVTQTQKGGQAKARPTNALKDLVVEMANHLYHDPHFISTPKFTRKCSVKRRRILKNIPLAYVTAVN